MAPQRRSNRFRSPSAAETSSDKHSAPKFSRKSFSKVKWERGGEDEKIRQPADAIMRDDDESADSEEEETGYMFGGIRFETYQDMVQAKRDRNRQLLVASGLLRASLSVKTSSKKDAAKTRRDSKKTTTPRPPARKSRRLAGEKAEGIYVDGEAGGKFSVRSEAGESLVDPSPEFFQGRINDGSDLSLEDVLDFDFKWLDESASMERAQNMLRSLLSKPYEIQSSQEETADDSSRSRVVPVTPSSKASSSPSSLGKTSVPLSALKCEIEDDPVDFAKMEVDCFAKMVTKRIVGITTRPLSEQLLIAASDTDGYVGLWNAPPPSSNDSSPTEAMGANCVLRMHTNVVSGLQWKRSGESLFTASYDGTCRLLDVESGTAQEVFATYDGSEAYKGKGGYRLLASDDDVDKDDDGYWRFQSAVLDPRNENCFFLSTSHGTALHVDLRVPPRQQVTFYKRLSPKKINSLSLHPNGFSLISAGLDQYVQLWDIRKWSAPQPNKNKRSSRVLPNRASESLAQYWAVKSVNGASFSPSGSHVVVNSMNHELLILDDFHLQRSRHPEGPNSGDDMIQAAVTLPYNHMTGRWLTTLVASWHPTDDVFGVGSLAGPPRRAEIFSAKGKRMASIQGPALGSVVSRCCFHHPSSLSSTDVALVGGNSSGRVYVFRTPKR